MRNSLYIKLLYSIPVILLLLYYIPFLGICVIIYRLVTNTYRKNKRFLLLLLLIGIIIIIPNLVTELKMNFNIKTLEIAFINKIVDTAIYVKLLSFSKLLITVSIIFILLTALVSFIARKLSLTLGSMFSNYIREETNKTYKIEQENNLKMKEKQERAKNTHVVFCSHCGADNMISGTTGKCRYCRQPIEYKK